jgi:hypothetical protein
MSASYKDVVKTTVLTAATLAFISTAQAQGNVVQSPGHRPAYAIPRGDGTYVIPGQRPTFIMTLRGIKLAETWGSKLRFSEYWTLRRAAGRVPFKSLCIAK